MHTPETPTRPWWRRKRWVAFGLFWLGCAYVVSEGPAVYAVARGWLPGAPVRAAYLPVSATVGRMPLLWQVRERHRSWWVDRGNRDRPKAIIYYCGDLAVTVTSNEDFPTGTWKARSGGQTFTLQLGSHTIAVESVRTRRDEDAARTGWVMLDGRRVATLPADTRQLSIEFLDEELSVEADGRAIEVED